MGLVGWSEMVEPIEKITTSLDQILYAIDDNRFWNAKRSLGMLGLIGEVSIFQPNQKRNATTDTRHRGQEILRVCQSVFPIQRFRLHHSFVGLRLLDLFDPVRSQANDDQITRDDRASCTQFSNR